VKEPDNKEGAADEPARETQAIPFEAYATEPKAYAFDGWSMVPIEPVTA